MPIHFIYRLLHRLFVSLLATLLSMSIAQAATWTVTSVADTGAGSLRQAIATAAANDTINFDASLNGQAIVLASELTVDKNLSFVGNGEVNTVIDGNNSVRLFNVSGSITASWIDMTLTKGRADNGGCVRGLAGSVLNLTRVTVSTCTATGSGGAIDGISVNLTDSTLRGNTALHGGGVNGQFLTILSSTLSGNTATDSGGAIALHILYSTGSVTNSTITGNSAGSLGGAISNNFPDNSLTILHSTIVGNQSGAFGGAFFSSAGIGNFSVGHTILAGNTAVQQFPDGWGRLESTGYNVIGDTTGMTISGTTTGNITDGAATPLSVGALADNGGPTKTVAIGLNSVAYNAGNAAIVGAPAFDQRGMSRVMEGRIDIGAYEVGPVVTISPATLNISEGNSANVTLTRTGGTTSDLTVNLSITQGTGITGADYTLSGAAISGQSGSVTATIPAGSASVNIAVAAVNDTVQESSEVLTLTLATGPSYDLGATTASAATLLDNDFVLTLNTNGAGSGTLGGSAAGTYNAGSALTLTATANPGSTFSGWSSGCSASFNMPSNDLTCTATFTLNNYTVTTAASPAGSGTVNCSPNPVDHGSTSTCSATPGTGYVFASWSGDCTGASCNLTNVTSAKSVTATFTPASASRSGIQTLISGVMATLSVSGCSAVDSATFIQPPAGAPSNVTYPYGLLDFTLSGCASTATVTVTYSQNLPSGARFYKVKAGSYSIYPSSIGANSVTFTLLDNDEWDGDGSNGIIKDPSGLGFGGASSIPTLSEWGLLILSALMGLGTVLVMRRRQA